MNTYDITKIDAKDTITIVIAARDAGKKYALSKLASNTGIEK